MEQKFLLVLINILNILGRVLYIFLLFLWLLGWFIIGPLGFIEIMVCAPVFHILTGESYPDFVYSVSSKSNYLSYDSGWSFIISFYKWLAGW